MAEQVAKPFLPPHVPRIVPYREGVSPPPKVISWKPDSVPAGSLAMRDKARALGQFAFGKLEIINKEYLAQASLWKKAFGDVLTAYALAISRKETVLKAAERELEREAAWTALVLSLATAGAMRFVGAHFQYTLLPKVFSGKTKLVPKNLSQWTFQPVTVGEISKTHASAIGGIVQDIGNNAATIARLSGSGGIGTSQDLLTYGGLELLRNNFNTVVEGSFQIVTKEFGDVQNWMITTEEFGNAWIHYSGYDTERARVEISAHLNNRRLDWANTWEFFGKTPPSINIGALAEHYERILWAGFLADLIYDDVGPVSVEAHVAEVKRRGNTRLAPRVSRQFANAIIQKLKLLNVVYAETASGASDQLARIGAGAPNPLVEVEDDFNSPAEFYSMKSWVDPMVKTFGKDHGVLYFPEATRRTLAPI